jgi:hypothetical protein
MMDLAIRHHLKHRSRRRNRQAASRLRFYMGEIQMRRVIGCQFQNYLRIKVGRAEFSANGAALFANGCHEYMATNTAPALVLRKPSCGFVSFFDGWG